MLPMEKDNVHALLEIIVNRLFMKYFHRTIDTHCKIVFNPKLEGKDGCFKCEGIGHNSHKTLSYNDYLLSLNPHSLEFKPQLLNNYGVHTFESIIKHELVHYYLWACTDYDCGHSKRFFRILHDIGGARLPPVSNACQYYLYRCTNCTHIHYTPSKMDLSKHYCIRCHSILFYDGKHSGVYISELINSLHPSYHWFN